MRSSETGRRSRGRILRNDGRGGGGGRERQRRSEMNKEEEYMEEKLEVQGPSSKSYLWDVFLYLRLSEKNKHKDSETSVSVL